MNCTTVRNAQSVLLVPEVETETYSGIQCSSLVTASFKRRMLYLVGEVNTDAVNLLTLQLLQLYQDGSDPITLVINSPGGSVQEGLALYDLMQMAPCEIHTVCIGVAASMGAILFAAGTKGHRYMLPHSKTMIHEPLIPGGVGGSATSIEQISQSMLRTKDMLNEILAQHTGQSISKVKKATSFDNYMDAESSVAFGLCDHILSKEMLLNL